MARRHFTFDPYARRWRAEAKAREEAARGLAEQNAYVARRKAREEAHRLAGEAELSRLASLGFFNGSGDASAVIKDTVVCGPGPHCRAGTPGAEVEELWVCRGDPDRASEGAVCVSGRARDVGAWLALRPSLWAHARRWVLS